MKKILKLALVVIPILLALSGTHSIIAVGGNLEEAELYDSNGTNSIESQETNLLFVDVVMNDGSLGWCPMIYEREQAEQEARAQEAGVFPAEAMSNSHGEVRVLHRATHATNRITIKIIADRYTAAQQEAFFMSAQRMADHIISSHPMYDFAPWIQIYGIGTISPNQNQSIIVGDGSAGTGQAQITHTNTRPFIHHHFPGAESNAYDHFWLVMQRDRNGGYALGLGLAVTSTSVGVGLHEIGHLWGLFDENNSPNRRYDVYFNGPNTRSDVNLANPTGGILIDSIGVNTAITPQWGLFIGRVPGANRQWEGVAGMGIYRMITYGWGETIWYRPSQHCVMNQGHSTSTFCPVCAEHLARRFAPGRVDNTRIRSYAHAGNTSLQTITIPTSITEIGDFAFIGATGLRTIHNNRGTPQEINSTTFAGLDRGSIDVMVPSGTSQAFANAGWTSFRLVEPGGNISTWGGLSFVMNDTDILPATPRTISHIGIPPGAYILEFLHDNHSGFTRFPRRDGHRIAGWYTDANFRTRLASTTTMPASELTLYAHWVPVPTPRFTDVPRSLWSHDSVQAISDAGIMQGTGERIFLPGRAINRAEFAVVLGNTHGVVTGDGFPGDVYGNYNIGLRFSDMGTDSRVGWSNQYVAWASCDSRRIITGFTDDTFRPRANITREQAATLLFRYEEYRLGREPSFNSATLNVFPDRGEISPWAEAGMAWAVQNRIIQGRDVEGVTRLLPNNYVQRQETAAMIYRYLGSDNVGLLHLLDEAAGSPLALAVSLGEAVHTFPSVPIGHDSQVAHTITIDNIGIRPTGALTIFLSGENADSFTLSATTLASVPSGDVINLTVWSNSGLAAGTHTATVTVYGINLMPQSIELTIEVGVDPPPPPTEFSGTSPAQLNALLAEGDVKLTTPASGGYSISANNTLIIPEGRTLYVEGVLNVRRHGTLIIEGTVVVLDGGRINNDGHSSNGGGTIEITKNGRLINYGYVENISNSYVFNNGRITNNGRFEVRANTTFIDSGVVDGSHPLRINRDAILQN